MYELMVVEIKIDLQTESIQISASSPSWELEEGEKRRLIQEIAECLKDPESLFWSDLTLDWLFDDGDESDGF